MTPTAAAVAGGSVDAGLRSVQPRQPREQPLLQQLRCSTDPATIITCERDLDDLYRQFTINDSAGKVRSDVLLDALQELRDAGAEVVELASLGGPAVRVVASTSFGDAEEGGVLVDGIRLEPPYRYTVIGDQRTLAAALDIPGGVLDVLDQNDATGVVMQKDELVIASLRPVPKPEYARSAPAAVSESE